jgi:MtrB/PioB family decaheme-associated outer membrane protein
MNNHKNRVFRFSYVAVAVAFLCTSMGAMADDEEVDALKLPAQTLEIGVINTSADSVKYGEYGGLTKAGTYLNSNVRLRGGLGYRANENGETNRWAVDGSDLGLESRSLSGSVSEQGDWAWSISYDELRHNLSGGYQTPYQGAMGGNNFTLPSSLNYITLSNPTTSAQYLANTPQSTFTGKVNNVAGTYNWASYLKDMEVYSGRKNTTLIGKKIIDGSSSLTFEYNQLKQDGAKLMAFATEKVGTGTTVTAEKTAILPAPTNYLTDTWNVGYNWKSEKTRLSVGYYGSFFRNEYNRINFQPAFGGASTTGVTQALSTAPDNIFNQLNIMGGHDYSNTLKLTSNLSWGRSEQNAPFVNDTNLQVGGTVPGSLNGLVDTTHFDAKIVDTAIKDLVLAAAFKYDMRDNQTASNMYNFNAISGSNPYNYPNTPLSTKKVGAEFSGDYKLNANQKLRVSYGHEDLDRFCNNYAASYGAGANCVVAKSSREDKLDTTFRQKLTDSADVKFGYSYSDRVTNNDIYAKAAMGGWTSGFTGPINVNGSSLTPGQNGGDYIGFRPFFDASRRQHALKVSSNWEVTDQLSFSASGRVTQDTYEDSNFGVSLGNSHGINLDATYAYRESGSIYGYMTKQDRGRDMTNHYQSNVASLASYAGNWVNKLDSSDITYGLGFKEDGLMSGKLTLKGDLSYSLANTYYTTNVLYSPATACTDASQLTCGATPTIHSATTQIKLSGIYTLDKNSKINVAYIYQRLEADDYYYNGLQTGYTPTGVIPTNQSAGGYSVQAVGASYIYSF